VPLDESLAGVLYIDLSRKSYRVEHRPELFDKYLGGTGAATALLQEECLPGTEALSPGNPIIFAVGPLTALFPLASKTVAMFKSPHTGNLGESHCGGRSAVAIRMAGYGAIVIKGASDIPVYLAIHGNQVYFRDASSFWGMRSSFTVGHIVRENEPGSGFRTIMRIGGAGEKLVSYAGVTTETYRHFGRLGLGAVFGSKKLKAIVVSGRRSIPVADQKQYRTLYDSLFQAATASSMKKYHDVGTAENIAPLNALGALPTRNLKEARFEGAKGISGETLAEGYLGRRLACSHCPVGCIHIAALRQPYADEPYFYKTSMICYDFETIYALGSMIGISDSAGFLKLMEQVEVEGLDAISTGVVLAWATEAQEKGLISEKETLGLKLAWGDYLTYLQAVKLIVEQPNDFYKHLAHGAAQAALVYGGVEFAAVMGGNEIPGYHTGPATHIGVGIGARHSHLDNAGYSVDQKSIIGKGMKAEDLAEALIVEERWRQVLSSLVVCFFARGIYSPTAVSEALQTAGFNLTPEQLNALGKEIHDNKYRFKLREGFQPDSLRLPGRFLETGTPAGQLDEKFFFETLASFKHKMGMDT
jgi:aldehyde:ferredoxin oxidoreductase